MAVSSVSTKHKSRTIAKSRTINGENPLCKMKSSSRHICNIPRNNKQQNICSYIGTKKVLSSAVLKKPHTKSDAPKKSNQNETLSKQALKTSNEVNKKKTKKSPHQNLSAHNRNKSLPEIGETSNKSMKNLESVHLSARCDDHGVKNCTRSRSFHHEFKVKKLKELNSSLKNIRCRRSHTNSSSETVSEEPPKKLRRKSLKSDASDPTSKNESSRQKKFEISEEIPAEEKETTTPISQNGNFHQKSDPALKIQKTPKVKRKRNTICVLENVPPAVRNGSSGGLSRSTKSKLSQPTNINRVIRRRNKSANELDETSLLKKNRIRKSNGHATHPQQKGEIQKNLIETQTKKNSNLHEFQNSDALPDTHSRTKRKNKPSVKSTSEIKTFDPTNKDAMSQKPNVIAPKSNNSSATGFSAKASTHLLDVDDLKKEFLAALKKSVENAASEEPQPTISTGRIPLFKLPQGENLKRLNEDIKAAAKNAVKNVNPEDCENFKLRISYCNLLLFIEGNFNKHSNA